MELEVFITTVNLQLKTIFRDLRGLFTAHFMIEVLASCLIVSSLMVRTDELERHHLRELPFYVKIYITCMILYYRCIYDVKRKHLKPLIVKHEHSCVT